MLYILAIAINHCDFVKKKKKSFLLISVVIEFLIKIYIDLYGFMG